MLRLAVLVLALLSPTALWAQEHISDLSKCLADSTTGRDRKELARWVFLAMAAHPEIKQYAAPSAAAATGDADAAVAAMFTRLLAEQCVGQTRAAIKQGGAVAIQLAFQTLGQLAMQELMSDPSVRQSMGGFEKRLDQQRLNKAFATE